MQIARQTPGPRDRNYTARLLRVTTTLLLLLVISAGVLDYGGRRGLYNSLTEDLLEAVCLVTLVLVCIWSVREQLRISAVKYTLVVMALLAVTDQLLDITEEVSRLDTVFILGQGHPLHSFARNLAGYGVGIALLVALLFTIAALEEERKRAERNEQEYRLLAENVHDVIWTTDLALKRTYVSPSVSRLRGYTVEQAIEQRIEDVLTPASLKVAQGMFTMVMAAQEAGDPGEIMRTVELEMNRRDGSSVWTEVRVSVLHDAEGKPTGVIGVTRDITERKQAEEALKASEERHRALIEQASDGIFVSDPGGVVIDVNSSGCKMIGHTREEVLGRRMEDFMSEQELETNPLRWEELRLGKRLLSERRLLCKGGTELPVEISTKLLPDGRAQGIVRDVRDRIRAAEEKAELEEELRQAQRMESIGRLAGGVAHDLNNLLSPVIGYAELALAQLGDNDALRAYLEDIHDGGQRAKDLTRQLLAFSRRQMLAMKVLNLSSLVADFEKTIHHLVEERVQVTTRLHPSLGSVKADPSQIRQILMNLAVNARDAMAGGGTLTIETTNVYLGADDVKAHGDIDPGPYVSLSVRDSGCGMAPEVQRHIYEPFFSTKEPGKGTGLGLATVYGIVKQHGGGISVESAPEQGTTFRVYLPQVNEAPEKSRAPAPVEPSGRGSETVLVVEDDGRVRKLACQILRKRGYDVHEARNAEEAFRISDEFEGSVELLLTDIVMPRMNGKELYERLADSRPDTKVLYMSGHSEDVIAHHGRLDPGVHFLQKPFSVQELMRKIRDVLDN